MAEEDPTPEGRFPRWAGGLIAVILILLAWLYFQFRQEPDNPRVVPAVTGTAGAVTGTAGTASRAGRITGTAVTAPGTAGTVSGAPPETAPPVPVVTGIETVTAPPATGSTPAHAPTNTR